jgi:hypothetical protein
MLPLYYSAAGSRVCVDAFVPFIAILFATRLLRIFYIHLQHSFATSTAI